MIGKPGGLIIARVEQGPGGLASSAELWIGVRSGLRAQSFYVAKRFEVHLDALAVDDHDD